MRGFWVAWWPVARRLPVGQHTPPASALRLSVPAIKEKATALDGDEEDEQEEETSLSLGLYGVIYTVSKASLSGRAIQP